ncbi:MAG TPA: methylaspartate mutase accessory protein GlmL [candidate division Zixibacteria bacterium]|nr:methylaspartate mutase accessory protein GlmL [candidate division Zixibacteria bacterium]
MKSPVLLIDFGSTYTKAVAVDPKTAAVLGESRVPSTVESDVGEGLVEALSLLHERHGVFSRRPDSLEVLEECSALASSSAAGGLKMAVVGLVPGLTVEAARAAALGAGARLIGAWSFKLDEAALAEIESRRPDMILLTGGTDGGDSATIVHNARLLARSSLTAPVVLAGNRAAAGEVRSAFESVGKEVRVVANVMPRPGMLDVEPARQEIRRLFMEHIIRAKGLDRIRPWISSVTPTPMAVLEGARIAAEAIGRGELLVVDVGGATTDVHSVGWGKAPGPGLVEAALPEPFAKRTVEGDLGIRCNARTIVERVGWADFEGMLRAAFPQYPWSRERLAAYVDGVSRETARLPEEPWQEAVDAGLARAAVDLAVERHAGRRERIVAREGEAWAYYGKDLSETRTVVGTGGIFVYNPYAAYILGGAPDRSRRAQVLRPANPELYADSSYLLYAAGLLSQSHPEAASRIFLSSTKRLAPLQAGL